MNCKRFKHATKRNTSVNQSQGKKKINRCRDPGLNRGPSDLQSDALPTELGLGEDRLTEGGKRGKREKMGKEGKKWEKK